MSTLLDAAWHAARLITEADSLIITAGAGMGVDSGLPDFRGPQGFWRAYPALGQLGLSFEEIANPYYFETDPELAWGFYGHRLGLYRATQPHAGFSLLREIAAQLPQGAGVFTSNVDGQFQKAGFSGESVTECHGSIHHLQCIHGCMSNIWSAATLIPAIDEAKCRMVSLLPRCPNCGAVARPNILMFGDGNWQPERRDQQQCNFNGWRCYVRKPVVIELGAGSRIPSVRRFGEAQRCPLIRINATEAQVTRVQDVAMQGRALESLNEIAACLRESGFLPPERSTS